MGGARRDRDRRGVRPLAVAALAAAALAGGVGCASFAPRSALQYGAAWKQLESQTRSASDVRGTPTPPPAPNPEADALFRRVPEAARAVQEAHKVLEEAAPSRGRVQRAIAGLVQAERLAALHDERDPALAAELRARLAALRRRVEGKLAEIAALEPSFDVADRGRVRVAVVRIGEGVETIRRAETQRWRAFLADAGFSADVAFVTSPLVGSAPSAADLRVAAARLGADAVLAYTTTAATTVGALEESVAVLAFAKCLLLDTRTEFLYLNAEGEGRLRRIGLPGTLTPRAVELECLASAEQALREDVRGELRRLEEARGAGGR